MVSTILVAVNLNEHAPVLIKKATEIAEKFNASVLIVHIAAPEPEFVGYTHDLQFVRDDRANELRAEHKTLQKYAADLCAKGLDARAYLIQGPTVATILEQSKHLKADLIVIGHHEHGLLTEIFLGSSFPGIVEKSKVPVLIIPY